MSKFIQSHLSDMSSGGAYRPDALPVNGNVVDDWIELRAYPIDLVFWEDDGTSMVAFLECP